MTYLKLTLFGGFEAALASGARVVLPTKKAQALLAYCALRPGQVHQREKLAALLWGDTEEANARNSLRQTLFVLRSALGENLSRVLRIEREAISADPGAFETDVLRFESLAGERTPQALEQAAALYRGDLLDGFIVDEEPFEQWLSQERERLRDLAMETLARLLRHQRAHVPTEGAIRTARRLLALDPLQEVVHRLLMDLLLQVGRREEALNQYEVCRRLLKRELNLEPEAETTRSRDAIIGGKASAPQDRRDGSVGRRPLEAAIPGVGAAKGRPEHRDDGAGPWALRRGGDGAGDLTQFHAEVLQWRQKLKAMRRVLDESRQHRLMLRRAFEENSRCIRAVSELVAQRIPRSGEAATVDVVDHA